MPGEGSRALGRRWDAQPPRHGPQQTGIRVGQSDLYLVIVHCYLLVTITRFLYGQGGPMNILKLTDRARPGSIGDMRLVDLGQRVSLTLGNDTGQTLAITLTHGELAGFIEALIDLAVDAARARTVNRPLPLTLTIKPSGRDTGQFELKDQVKTSLPAYDRGMTLLFATPEGNLQRENPRQAGLDLRSADEPKPTTDNLKEAQE